MKNKGLIITLICIVSLVLISFVFILIHLLKNDFRINNILDFRNNNEVVIDTTYDTVFNNIDITMEYGKINIYESNDNLIHLYVYGVKDKSEISTTDTNLNINVKAEECHFICINKKQSEAKLYIPADYNGNIKILTNYGDIKIGSLSSTNLSIESDYGDIKVDSIRDLYIDASYGNIDVLEITNKLDIESDYGDVNINKLVINEDSKIFTEYGDIDIKSTNDLFIEAHTDLGKVKVEKSNRLAEHVLTIENNCGDIKVN